MKRSAAYNRFVPETAVRHDEVTVRVVDNHPALLRGVERLVGTHEHLRLLGSHLHVADIDFEHDQVPDVVVLDLYLGRDDELSTPWIQRLVDWGTKVLLHTSVELAVPLRDAVSAGAAGLSLKADGLDSLYNSTCAVADGEFACSSPLAQALVSDPELIARLSQREREVVSGLDDGLTQQQIARRMHVEPSTVKEHLKSVRHKYLALGRTITNSHSIVREAKRDGWV